MTSSIHINRRSLRADILAISREICVLKRQLRATWLRPMGAEQRELSRLQRRATELCALSAFARGKLHLRRPPRGAASDWSALAYHRLVTERLGPSYSLLLEQSA